MDFCTQELELQLRQAEGTIANLRNQLDDRESRVELLKKRLERLSGVQAKFEQLEQKCEEFDIVSREAARKGEIELQELKQLLLSAEETHQKKQTYLQHELDNRQRKIEELQQQLKREIAEKEQTQALIQQVEKECAKQAESELSKLNRRIQQAEATKEQLETKLQNQRVEQTQQQEKLQAQLSEARQQIKDFTQREQMAKVALSQWFQSDLLEHFVIEIEGITDRIAALEGIKRLQQKRLNREWQDFPTRRHSMQLVLNFLKQGEENFREKLQLELEKFHIIEVVDAILTIRAELKFHRIIQRDSKGDYLH